MATELTNYSGLSEPSLPEVHASVRISRSPLYWRRLLGFMGPGFLISVGYMDPGNWATDIAGGSRFGYTLLFVIMASNLMAILLQSLSLKLGIATERDLAQACRESSGRAMSFVLWVMAEVAIAACDMAEVIGSAIALQLLFHIPLFYGVLITGTDVLLILLLQRWGFRYVEALVIALIGTIVALFGIQMILSRPEYWPVFTNLLIPSKEIVSNPGMGRGFAHANREASCGGLEQGQVWTWWAVGSRQFWIRHVCAVSVESRVRGVAAEFSRVNGIRQEVPECGQWRVGPQDAG